VGGETESEAPGGPGPTALARAGEGDFLEQNGLGSPLCRSQSALDRASRVNCSYSGFTAAPAPTGNYAFDVHIDTGLTHIGNTAVAVVEDLLQWGWMVLVALVRGLTVVIEWCFSLDLLSGAVLREVARALRAAQATLTLPALAPVLAVASILFVYQGLIRRRVAQTLGEALLMTAMIVAGLWAMLDPVGTVGALGVWVDRVSVATVAALAEGTPDRAGATLARAMRATFGDVITGPWCYLEFGNVDWCRDPARTDPRLRRAALRVAREADRLAATRFASGEAHRSLITSAALLAVARTNGTFFLALPANGAARNSINDSGSLLSVLCGGSAEATHCEGPTAAEAEFRTEHGVGARVIGLALVWLGAIGMLSLFGWLALRLLSAAVLALLLLLAAPAAVLAPALGDAGRRVFRGWATRLLGAVTAKLVYSLLLGVVLLMMNLLGAVPALGWWIQWALISSIGWIVVLRRREILEMARMGDARPWTPVQPSVRRRAPAVAAGGRLAGTVVARATRGAGRLSQRLAPPPVTAQRARRGEREEPRHAGLGALEQVEATLNAEYERAAEQLREAPAAQAEITARREQLARVQVAREAVEQQRGRQVQRGDGGDGGDGADREDAGSGDHRAVRLAVRARRIEAEIAERQATLSDARAVLQSARVAGGRGGPAFSDKQLSERGRLLDQQMGLPDSRSARGTGPRRDYRRLAPLAGMSERDWDALVAEHKRAAMLSIDRRLAERVHDRAPGSRLREGRTSGSRPSALYERPAVPPGGGTSAAGQSGSLLAAWLEEERRRAAAGGSPETLAERARKGRWEGDERDGLARRRRQLRRQRPLDE
jgi:hypothetical protein